MAKYISIAQAAKILDMMEINVRIKMRTGEIDGIKQRRRWFCDLDSVMEYKKRTGGKHKEKNPKINGENAFSLADFAERYGLSVDYVRYLVRKRILKPVKLSGRLYILDSEVKAFERTHERGAKFQPDKDDSDPSFLEIPKNGKIRRNIGE